MSSRAQTHLHCHLTRLSLTFLHHPQLFPLTLHHYLRIHLSYQGHQHETHHGHRHEFKRRPKLLHVHLTTPISSPHTNIPSTTLNSTSSPLLRLPGELRNQIWEYALSDRTYRIVRALKGGYDVTLSRPPAHHLALLSVCRQTRSEALMLPFPTNVFSFGAFDVFQDFATGLPMHQRRAITSLALGPEFQDWGWYFFVRYVQDNDEGACVRDLFPGVKEVVVDKGFHEFDELHAKWRYVLGSDAVGMKGAMIKWLRGGEGEVEVRFGNVERTEGMIEVVEEEVPRTTQRFLMVMGNGERFDVVSN